MEETLITQTTTQAGQKKKKAVKYINPSATNEKLKGFAQQIVALTTDNFDGASVTSYRTKGEVIFTDKPTPNLSIGSWSAVDTVYSAPITYDGDGTLSVNVGSISNGSLIVADEDGIFSGVLTASAGESYAATNLNFTYSSNEIILEKADPNLSISVKGTSYLNPTLWTSIVASQNGDGTISVDTKEFEPYQKVLGKFSFRGKKEDKGKGLWRVQGEVNTVTSNLVKFYVDETANYKASSIIFYLGKEKGDTAYNFEQIW